MAIYSRTSSSLQLWLNFAFYGIAFGKKSFKNSFKIFQKSLPESMVYEEDF